ncbi:MAG TPA: hypothetical protein VK210_01855 [Terriglobia bacterium]|nr:hypothetical protein [Terriglobia bacterium]
MPLFGTWKLNIAKSVYNPGPPPYKRTTCRIEPTPDGLKVIYDMVGIRGGVTHIEWTGKFDGRDYPVEGLDYVLTNAYTRIDDRTYDVMVKLDGSKAATARISISPDGRTLTTVTTARNAEGRNVNTTTVYDRQ